MNDSSPSSKYRFDIDGLRAIAVLLILVFHFDLIPGWHGGFIGVDIFFVISGYLITSIIKKQLDHGDFSISKFYIARVRRLAPALLATLLLAYVFALLTLFPDDLIALTKQLVASQFYVANIYYWQSVNYFGLHAGDVFLLHTWSLAVEEQFYLVFPLFLIFIHKYFKKYLKQIIFLTFIISFSVGIFFVDSKPEATFYLFPTRAWELLVGSLTALLLLQGIPSKTWTQILGGLGYLLIGYALVSYSRDVVFPGYFALLPVFGASFLIISGTRASFSVRTLSLPVMTYIGRISYPLYLVHWPVNVFAGHLLGTDYLIQWRIVMFGLSIFIATFIYYWVENPVRTKSVLASNKNLIYSYTAACFISLLQFGVTLQSSGLPQRFPSEAIRLASFVNDKTQPLSECEFKGNVLAELKDMCQIGAAGKSPTWLVYGDSHAWAAYSAFNEWLTIKGESGQFIFIHSCIPVMGVHMFKDRGACYMFNESVNNYLTSHGEIKNVLIVSTWRQAMGALTTDTAVSLTNQQSVALFQDKFAATVRGLSQLGKRVYLWEPAPGAKQNVPLSLATAAIKKRPVQIEFTREEYLSEFNFFFAALRKNKESIWLTFSPSLVLCSTGLCSATLGGLPAYFDNAHVSKSSAKYWVQMMLDAEAKNSKNLVKQ